MEYTESIVIVTTNMKIVLGIAVLILAGEAAYLYTHPRQTPAGNAPVTVQLAQQPVEGQVTSVSPESLEIVISTALGNKTIKIDPTTKINEVVTQKSAAGVIEKQISVEVNIADVQKGGRVIVLQYLSDTDNVLSGVKLVIYRVDENVDAYYKQRAQLQNTMPSLSLHGQVVLLDIANKKIEYKPYLINTIGTTTISVSFPDNIPVYRVDTASRVFIIHARIPATLADIKPGSVIFLMVDNKALQTGKIVPQAFIIPEI